MRSRKSQRRYTMAMLGLVTVAALCLSALRASAQGTSDWTVPVNFSQQPDLLSDYPVLLCDQYQNLHLFWIEIDADQTLIYHRTDAGGSWSNPVDVLITRSVADLAAVIAPDDTVHLAWNLTIGGDLLYSQAPLASASDARRWIEPQILAAGVDGASMAVDSTGTLHIAYATTDTRGTAHTLYHIQSDDGGKTWTQPASILYLDTPVPAYIADMLKVDGKHRLHLVWQIRSINYGEYSRLGYMRSLDQGETWSAPMELAFSETAPGVAAAAVYTFGDDEIHLTYDTPERLHQWSDDGGTTWSQPVTIVKLGAAFGGFNQLAKDDAGTLHAIAAVSDGVYHLVWNGSSWNPPEAIDRRYNDPHRQQLVVCQGNQLDVAYRDHSEGQQVWYSTKQIQATHVPQRPIPPPAQPTPTRTPTAFETPTITTQPEITISESLPSAQSGSVLFNPLLLPAVPVLLLIFIVAAVVLLRLNR